MFISTNQIPIIQAYNYFCILYQIMYQDRYKVHGLPNKKQFAENNRKPSKEFPSKLSTSKKKMHHSPQFTRKSYFDEELMQQTNKAQPQRVQHKLNCEKDSKLSALIYETISSADRVVKQILNYNIPQLESTCSKYFLGKQRLYSYLHSQSITKNPYKPKVRKLSKYKPRRQENSQDEKEEVSLKQLRRLEEIVNNKIIPILKQQLYRDKRKYSKINRNIEVTNPEQREGMFLLQKLSSKGKKFNLNDYIEVLQDYILKVMDNQRSLMEKVNELQLKLQSEIRKLGQYQNFIKKRQEQQHEDDIQRANQLKRFVRHEQFIKSIQLILKDEEEDHFVKETQNLDSLVQRVRKLLNTQGHQKTIKHVHGQLQNKQRQSDSQSGRNEQLKHTKEVIRTLNNQIGSLKEQCQNLYEKLRSYNEDILQAQNKQKRLSKQNQSNNFIIQKLNEQIYVLNKMVQQNLAAIGRFEEELINSSQNYVRLQQAKNKQEEQVSRQREENQKLLRHIVQIQGRYHQSSELQAKKDKQFDDIIQNLYSKEVQLKQMNRSIERYQKQLKIVNSALIEREELILQLQEKIRVTQQELIRLAKQPQVVQPHQNKPQAIKTIEQNLNSGHCQQNQQPQKKQKAQHQSVAQTVVVDNLFIDQSEPNHRRQDFIPGRHFKDNQPEPNHLRQDFIPGRRFKDNTNEENQNSQELPKITSQLSPQKQNHVQLECKNLQSAEKKIEIIVLQSDKQRSRREEAALIKIEGRHVQQNAQKVVKKLENSQNGIDEQNSEFENVYYQQLLNTNKNLREQIIVLLTNSAISQNIQQVDLLLNQIRRIQNKLQACTRNIKQNLKKLSHLQEQNVMAVKQILYLKYKVQASNQKNQFVSNIPSESQGSGFSQYGQLRQMLKQKTPNFYSNLGYKYSQFVEQNLKKAEKVDAGIQTESILRVNNFYQSQVFRYLPQIKRILSRQQTLNETINKSLIDELQLLNNNKIQKSLKLQSLETPLLDQEGMLNASTPQKLHLSNQQISQNLKKGRVTVMRNSVKEIGSLINYHKEQLINLHMLLKENNFKTGEPLTPNKRPLIQNQQFIQKITQAPEKPERRENIDAQEEIVMRKLEFTKLNQSPINKQQVYELTILQKQDEIFKLTQAISVFNRKLEDKDTQLQQYNQLKIKFKQLLSLNEELKRQVAFLMKAKSKISQKGWDQLAADAQNQVYQAQQQIKVPENVAKNTLQEQLNNQIQQVEETVTIVSQKGRNQKTELQEKKVRHINAFSKNEFTWKDLFPEYFSQKHKQQKKPK